MVVWFISKYASIPKYGAASRLFYLADAFNKQGLESILITSDSNHLCCFPETNHRYNQEKVGHTKVHWIRTKKYNKTASLSRVLSWIDFEIGLFRLQRSKLPRPKVIIVSSLSLFTIIYGYYLKRYYKAKLIFEVRDIWPLTMTEEGGFSKWHPLVLLLRFIEKFGYRKADLIVGTMPKLDIHVKESIGEDRPFFCSPIGFDYEQWEKNKLAKCNSIEAFFPKGKVIVGYAGSMGVSNALDPFIACIQKMASQDWIHFVLTGGGDLRARYEEQLHGYKNVTFVPKIKAKDVPSFLAKCDILYLSTQDSVVWRYGQSMNKVVEYMLAGKPVVATYSGYPSMLNEAKSGIFIAERSVEAIEGAILKFAHMTNAEREKIGKKGLDWILERRSYKTLANDYIKQVVALTHEKKSS